MAAAAAATTAAASAPPGRQAARERARKLPLAGGSLLPVLLLLLAVGLAAPTPRSVARAAELKAGGIRVELADEVNKTRSGELREEGSARKRDAAAASSPLRPRSREKTNTNQPNRHPLAAPLDPTPPFLIPQTNRIRLHPHGLQRGAQLRHARGQRLVVVVAQRNAVALCGGTMRMVGAPRAQPHVRRRRRRVVGVVRRRRRPRLPERRGRGVRAVGVAPLRRVAQRSHGHRQCSRVRQLLRPCRQHVAFHGQRHGFGDWAHAGQMRRGERVRQVGGPCRGAHAGDQQRGHARLHGRPRARVDASDDADLFAVARLQQSAHDCGRQGLRMWRGARVRLPCFASGARVRRSSV